MPSSECTNPHCEQGKHHTAESYDALRARLLSHHHDSLGQVDLGGGEDPYTFHACKEFHIMDDAGILVGIWLYAHDNFNGNFLTTLNFDNT